MSKEIIAPEFFDGQIYANGEKVVNYLSGESIFLDPISLSVYDFIKGCEALHDVGILNTSNLNDFDRCMDWFMENNPEAYMILLD